MSEIVSDIVEKKDVIIKISIVSGVIMAILNVLLKLGFPLVNVFILTIVLMTIIQIILIIKGGDPSGKTM